MNLYHHLEKSTTLTSTKKLQISIQLHNKIGRIIRDIINDVNFPTLIESEQNLSIVLQTQNLNDNTDYPIHVTENLLC